jgi:hypothetical protein
MEQLSLEGKEKLEKIKDKKRRNKLSITCFSVVRVIVSFALILLFQT